MSHSACTFNETGRNYALGTNWKCYTCGITEGMCVCTACKDLFHTGHDVEKNHAPYFCDMGAGDIPFTKPTK